MPTSTDYLCDHLFAYVTGYFLILPAREVGQYMAARKHTVRVEHIDHAFTTRVATNFWTVVITAFQGPYARLHAVNGVV